MKATTILSLAPVAIPTGRPMYLNELINFLRGFHEPVPLPLLMALLAQLQIDKHELAKYIEIDDKDYKRNTIDGGTTWFEPKLLCWRKGQRSPIHDHAGSTCAVRVLWGTATETLYQPLADMAPDGVRYARKLWSHVLMAGSVVGSQDGDVHEVANVAADGADLGSLHLYSPPLALERIGKYRAWA